MTWQAIFGRRQYLEVNEDQQRLHDVMGRDAEAEEDDGEMLEPDADAAAPALGGAVQIASIKTRVESAYGFSA